MNSDETFRRTYFHSTWFTVLLVLSIPFAIYAAFHTPIGTASVHEWLPSDHAERKIYDRFVEQFGDDQFLMVTWEGCNAVDPRVERYQEAIKSLDPEHEWIEGCTSTGEVLRSLTAPPLSLSSEEARNRLAGFWVGPNEEGVVIVQFTPKGVAKQSQAIEVVEQAVLKVPGLDLQQARFAGTLYEAHAVDLAAGASLKKLVLPSTIAATIIAWICLERFQYALIVFLLAGLGQLSSVALIYLCGDEFSAVLIVLPTLVFMLTLAGAIHLVSYYKEVLNSGARFASSRALWIGLAPCFWSTITTVIGDGSLYFSRLRPIRDFGWYCGAGLTIATLILFGAFPAIAQWISQSQSQLAKSQSKKRPENSESLTRNWFRGWTDPIAQNASLVSMLGIAILCATCWGVAKLQTTTKFDTMFSHQSKTIRDMQWIEEHIGPLASIEVLVSFDASNPLSPVERALCIASLDRELRTDPCVGSVLCLTSFLPQVPRSHGLGAVSKRAVLNRKLEDVRTAPEFRSLIAQSEQGETWRLTAKVSSLREDYGYMADRVRKGIERSLPKSDSIHFQVTGLSPVMHHTQKMLLWDLGSSFASAFLLITPIMMLVARSVLLGLLIMIPNLVPITIVFGIMGWAGWKLDIAGILTASIALGIAVDDTLHFVTRYMEKLREGLSPTQAVDHVLATCGNAILFTTLINCSAMLPFVWSEFLPTSQFAFMMVSILMLAVFGDLILLPALLISPLGQWVCRSRFARPSTSNAS